MEVIAELHEAGDGLPAAVGRVEVAGEEDKGDVAHILGRREVGQVPDLEGRLPERVDDLGRGLDGWQFSGVCEFLRHQCQWYASETG
jgi:hypothetical protein